MILRVARHTTDLNRIRAFYTEVLGLNFLGEFKNHDGYDGIFLGLENVPWHLEFTCTNDQRHIERMVDEDDLTVFYPTTQTEYERILSKLDEWKIKRLTPKNPYWKTNGILFHDPDQHAIILSPLRIVADAD